jgi:hypothetical protein
MTAALNWSFLTWWLRVRMCCKPLLERKWGYRPRSRTLKKSREDALRVLPHPPLGTPLEPYPPANELDPRAFLPGSANSRAELYPRASASTLGGTLPPLARIDACLGEARTWKACLVGLGGSGRQNSTWVRPMAKGNRRGWLSGAKNGTAPDSGR